MRKLVRKVIVNEVTPIENSDNLELAHVGGWQMVVAKKDNIKSGDVGVFFEIDAALPVEDSRFEFLAKSSLRKFCDRNGKILDQTYRIKTCKLRGALSQGLLMPIALFPELAGVPLEEDVSDILKVRHFDEIAAVYAGSNNCGNSSGTFPSYIQKTDEERIQNLSHYFETMKDVEFEVTRKVDGSSMTVFYAPSYREGKDPFGVCSRNFELDVTDESSTFVTTANEYKLREKLEQYYNKTGKQIAIQGELNGPGINKNRDMLTTVNFKLFKIWDIDEQRFFTPEERITWSVEYDVPHVPVIHRHFKAFTELPEMNIMLKYSDGLTENGNPREGLVYKSEDGKFSFKAVSNAYLLNEK